MSDTGDRTSPDGTREQSAADVSRQTPRALFAPGDVLPNLEMWVLDRKLGGGGFGEVWLARHDRKGEAAVKFCTDPTARHQLITHERTVVARVMKHSGDHPNIVPLLECNLSGDIPWLMYEYVEGGTLAEAIERWKPLPVEERLDRAIRTLRMLAAALGTFHRLVPPIVHRDMKPQNVMMAGETPRITDFGIGGAVLASTISDSTPECQLVPLPEQISSSGSFRYASPEQLFGSPPNPRDDVYALGVIAYQMITADLKYAPGTDASDELRGLNVPPGLITLITTSVALNADLRPNDAGGWVTALNALPKRARLAAPAPTPPPKPAPPPSGISYIGLIPLTCSSCGGRFRVRRDLVGKEAKCIHCQGTVKVPASG